MSSDINTVTLVGNLTRDCEMKYTNSGTAICNFSLAVNEKYGETDYVSYLDFTIWISCEEWMLLKVWSIHTCMSSLELDWNSEENSSIQKYF